MMHHPVAQKTRLPSLLPPPLRALLRAALALAWFMVADTLFLLLVRLAERADLDPFAVGAARLPALYQVLLLAHTGVGVLLTAVMLVFLVAHLPWVWRRVHPESVWTGVAYAVLGLALLVSGLFILSDAASRANRWAWWLHVVGAGVVVLAYLAHRAVSYSRPTRARVAGYLASAAAGALVLFLAHGWEGASLAARAAAPSGGPGGPARGAQGRLAGAFGPSGWVPVGAVPPESPFFPSAATTEPGTWLDPSAVLGPIWTTDTARVRAEASQRGFAVSQLVGADGCVSCHPDVTEQWAASAHRFASFNNPFYEATIRDLRERADAPHPWVARHIAAVGGPTDLARVRSQWCAGCHDPALLFTGTMRQDVDRGSVAAQAGLTCLACHAIDAIHDRTGNGNYNLATRDLDPYVFAGAPPGTLKSVLHDAVLKARPAAHKARFVKPVFREGLYCATCHKVSLTEPVNGYRWLRGQNEFDNWDDSGVAHNASRTFYLPERRRVCQDCHMPPEPAPKGDLAAEGGTVRSHRFLAVNTALPYLRGDTATLRRIETFLQAEKLRVDIFAVRDARADEPVPLRSEGTGVPAGVPVTVDVVVRNLGVGHTFPGGTNDSNEGWLEFRITADDGSSLAVSGALDEEGRLDPMAHTFKAVMVDAEGEPIHRRNAQDIRAVVYQNVIGPGTSDLAHYRFTLPRELQGRRLTLTARLLWRKFDRAYTAFAFANNPEGFAGYDRVPDLPVTVIAADTVHIDVVGGGAHPGPAGETPPEEWSRLNDYGIGLLLEGDTRAAAQIFAELERLRPDLMDAPLNLARTALAEGNLEAAYTALERAEDLRPGDPRAAWVWARVLQEDGRYREAEAAYRRVLEDFPGDRAAWRGLGRTRYLDGRFSKALEALERALEIDPEDRVAHYHRMLALRALGREEEAARAEAAYLYYGIDESALERTLRYRNRDPGANLMAQPIPIHQLEIVQVERTR